MEPPTPPCVVDVATAGVALGVLDLVAGVVVLAARSEERRPRLREGEGDGRRPRLRDGDAREDVRLAVTRAGEEASGSTPSRRNRHAGSFCLR